MKTFYKTVKAFTVFIIILLSLNSCFFGNDIDKNNDNSNSNDTYLQVNGRYILPVDSGIDTNTTTSRSATASLPDNYTYFISANTSDNTLTSEGIINAESKTFSINLRTGYTWNIMVGIKDSANNILLSDSFEKELTRTDAFLNHIFNLLPHRGGNGSVELTVNYSDEYTLQVASEPSASFSVNTIDGVKKIIATNIPSGTYSLTLTFTKSSISFPFITTQTINVFNNLTTSKWHSGGNALINSSGRFELTDSIFQLARESKTEFYVDPNIEDKTTADENNTGNYTSPLGTIKRAIELINAFGDNTKTYNIHVKNTSNTEYISGATTINKNIAIECYESIPGDKQGSITIKRNTGASFDVFSVNSGKAFSITGLNINGNNIGGNLTGVAITVSSSGSFTMNNGKIESFEKGIDGAGILNLYGGEITGNKYGICTGTEKINLKGSPKINNNADGTTPHNLEITASSPKLQIVGPLSSEAEIWISGLSIPNGSTYYAFTENFTQYSPNVYAQEIFSTNTSGCAVTKLTDGTNIGEAAIAINGGSIALEDIYEQITLEIDNPLISETNPAANVYNFTAIKAKGTENEQSLSEGVTYSYKVLNHGIIVPSGNNGYYTTDGARLTFKNNMPIDDYVISVNAKYNDRSYSANFKISDALYLSYLTEAPTSGTFKLNTLDELKKIKDWASPENTFDNVTFKLSDDINTNGESIIIGALTSNRGEDYIPFKGTFDGNGHKITNTINVEYDTWSNRKYDPALFREIEGNAVIKNLTIAGTSKSGSLVSLMKGGTVENCISEVNITNSCTNSSSYTGGLISTVQVSSGDNDNSPIIIRNCINKGSLTNTAGSNGTASLAIGGIVGYLVSSAGYKNCIIENCINMGNITAYRNWIGGIIGYFNNYSSNSSLDEYQVCIMRNCKNKGNIEFTTNNSSAGGLIGHGPTNGLLMINCNNLGSIKNTDSNNVGTGLLPTDTKRANIENSRKYIGVFLYNSCNTGMVNNGLKNGGTVNYYQNYSLEGKHIQLSSVTSTNWSEAGIEDPSPYEKSFTSAEVDSIIAQLNNCNPTTEVLEDWNIIHSNAWLTEYNSTIVTPYKPWKKNADGLPELDLGELDTIADSN